MASDLELTAGFWPNLGILVKDAGVETNHLVFYRYNVIKRAVFSGALLPYTVAFSDPGPRSVAAATIGHLL